MVTFKNAEIMEKVLDSAHIRVATEILAMPPTLKIGFLTPEMTRVANLTAVWQPVLTHLFDVCDQELCSVNSEVGKILLSNAANRKYIEPGVPVPGHNILRELMQQADLISVNSSYHSPGTHQSLGSKENNDAFQTVTTHPFLKRKFQPVGPGHVISAAKGRLWTRLHPVLSSLSFVFEAAPHIDNPRDTEKWLTCFSVWQEMQKQVESLPLKPIAV